MRTSFASVSAPSVSPAVSSIALPSSQSQPAFSSDAAHAREQVGVWRFFTANFFVFRLWSMFFIFLWLTWKYALYLCPRVMKILLISFLQLFRLLQLQLLHLLLLQLLHLHWVKVLCLNHLRQSILYYQIRWLNKLHRTVCLQPISIHFLTIVQYQPCTLPADPFSRFFRSGTHFLPALPLLLFFWFCICFHHAHSCCQIFIHSTASLSFVEVGCSHVVSTVLYAHHRRL